MSDSTTGQIDIRACSEEDKPGLAELFDLCFRKDDGATVVPWRYDRNPHGETISLLVEENGQRLVAAYASFPRLILHYGSVPERAVVGQTGDIMTLPDQRGRGLFSALNEAAMAQLAAQGWPAGIGLPNRKSAPIMINKLGWREVGRVRPWSFVLQSDAPARSERLRAGRLAAWAVPWARLQGARARAGLRKRSTAGLDVRPVARFDSAVDTLVQGVARDWPWMMSRDQHFLNWRFLDAPSGRFEARAAFSRDGELRGYCVLQRPGDGGTVGYLADLVGADDTAVACLLDAALGALQELGASIVRSYAVIDSWWERQLGSAGFRAPKQDDYKCVIAWIHDPEHPLGQAVLDPTRWYFTDADRDDELIS